MKMNFKKLTLHILDVLTKPKIYFSKIVADGNLDESMLRAFMYGLFGGLLIFFINIIGGAPFTFSSLFSSIIITPVMAVLLLFVFGGLLMLFSEITGGERDWEISIKSLASVFFIYPIILIVNALAFNCTSVLFISILVDAYVLFLVYNIGMYCMKGKRKKVLITTGIISLFIFVIYLTDLKIGWLMLKNTGATLECLI